MRTSSNFSRAGELANRPWDRDPDWIRIRRIAFVTKRFVSYVAVIYCINLALSLLGALTLNPRIYRPWLAWVLTTFDVIIFLAIIELGPVVVAYPETTRRR
jgi:hypothetical protein